MYALVDANNFYVSCEKVFKPALEGKAVIVLSNNDGCIISRSNEAKALGLKMAEPAFNKKQYLKENNVHVFSSNYALYGDMSNRIIRVLETFTPRIEVYSIDESFLDLTGFKYDNLEKLGSEIKRTVKQYIGIDVSVGISKTKALAKIANKLAKTNELYEGICVLNTKREIDCGLRNTLISDVWGIGKQYRKFLQANNILNANDFISTNDNWIRKYITVVGLRLKKELQGTSCIPLETMLPAKKAIATTRGFGKIITNVIYLKEAVSTYATRCSEKLRAQNSVANILTVFIHTDPFSKDKYEYLSKTIHLDVSTNSQIELAKFALKGLKMIFIDGLRYKKAGVIVDGLESANNIQTGLYSNCDFKAQKQISEASFRINQKYGRDTLKLAIQGDGKEWKLKQEMLSGKYTTQWNDIIKVTST
ncbi:MAG: Y-family DNA polymerase [Bacteroidales bacterium]|jgi:DNA polymerase V|nr:Y-family DNA polymerase [Bacteroidales bacterium]